MRTWNWILTAALATSMSAVAQQAADSPSAAQPSASDATQAAQPTQPSAAAPDAHSASGQVMHLVVQQLEHLGPAEDRVALNRAADARRSAFA